MFTHTPAGPRELIAATGRKLLPAGILIALLPAITIMAWPEPGSGATSFDVNSPADVVDANPGDGMCSTALPNNNVCTLRAAVQETNALPGADTINLQGITYTLSIPGTGFDPASANGDLYIRDHLAIIGVANSAIDGNGVVTGERVLTVEEDMDVSLSYLTITGGRSAAGGGGLYNEGGNITLDHVTMNNNTASGGSGGAINRGAGSVIILASTISGNSASFGGGIYTDGTLTVRDSTISGNTAIDGGGIYKGSQGGAVGELVRIVNSTISSNGADRNGGGFYAYDGGSGFYNATVADNVANGDADQSPGAGYGGGIHVLPAATVIISNTIVADNSEYVYAGGAKPPRHDSNCYGTVSSAGNNIVPLSHLTECSVTGPSVSTADPLLGNLLNNGGPTLTHAIPVGSPAVDAGNPGGCTDNLGAPLPNDQRGYSRSGARCDIGAFEYEGGAPPTPTPTPSPTPGPTPSATATPLPTVTPTETFVPSPTPTPTPTPTVEPSATFTLTPTAIPTPTTTASPTSTDGAGLQGDVDCNGMVNSVDSLKILRHVAELPVSQEDECPPIGDDSGALFGDVDCSDAVDSVDALKILRFVVVLSVAQDEPCPDINEPL
jgi:predicted outer membrane repeat protein